MSGIEIRRRAELFRPHINALIMNLKQILSVFTLLLFFTTLTHAQPKISFNEKVHDFGTIMWNSPVTAEFKVINDGNKPLVITKVTTSCGCTVAGWTKEPIMPGTSGFVKSTFDAKAIGRFHKTVGVYCNASNTPIYLTIKGTVSTEVKNYDAFPYQIGNIRLDRTEIEFADANKGDQPVAEINLVNTSDKPYEPVLMHLPPYLKAEAVPAKLGKDGIGKIKLTLDSKHLMNLGLTQTSVYLARFPGDKVGEGNEITVSAVLLPDFSRLTGQQKLNAPAITLSATELNMGALEAKDRVTHKVTITNTGKSRLDIKELQVFNPIVNVSLKKRYIEPGASTTLKISLRGKGLKKLKSSPRVLMITNDPAHPKVMIKIKATTK